MQIDNLKSSRMTQENEHLRRTSQFLASNLGKENFAEGAGFNLLLNECEEQNQLENLRGSPRATSQVEGERGERSSSTKRAHSAHRQTSAMFQSEIQMDTITAMAESVLAKRKRKTMKFERENAKGLLRLPLDQYSI